MQTDQSSPEKIEASTAEPVELRYDHLIGIDFEVGRNDCFSLVRKFFANNFGVPIRNLARPKDWDADKLNLIEASHEDEGFVKLAEWDLKSLHPADVLCVAVGTSNANHFAIYIGNNEIIHHKVGHRSGVETLREFWRKQTCYVLRHPAVPDLRPELPTIQIKELIDARTRLVPSA